MHLHDCKPEVPKMTPPRLSWSEREEIAEALLLAIEVVVDALDGEPGEQTCGLLTWMEGLHRLACPQGSLAFVPAAARLERRLDAGSPPRHSEGC